MTDDTHTFMRVPAALVPAVEALLRGEAVAVPKTMPEKALRAVHAYDTHFYSAARAYQDILAASPYAPPAPEPAP